MKRPEAGTVTRSPETPTYNWEPGRFSVKGALAKSVTIQDCAFAAYPSRQITC